MVTKDGDDAALEYADTQDVGEVEQQVHSSNGHEPMGIGQRRPGMQDMAVRYGLGMHNPIKEMMTVPQDAEGYFARTRLSDKEIAQMARIYGKVHSVYEGWNDVNLILWHIMAMRVSLNGQGREEVVEMTKAERRDRQLRMGGGGMLSRFRTMNRGEEVSTGA